MTDPFANWPPVITDGRHSRLVVWRDVLLTLFMWGVLFAILYTELAFAAEAVRVLLNKSDAQIDAGLELFVRRMRPLMGLIAGLVLMLAISTLASSYRRRRAMERAQPTPLPEQALADITGLSTADLSTARTLKRAIVSRTGGAGLKVEAAGAIEGDRK